MVANWVKKHHKINENSRIAFKWEILEKWNTIKEQQKVEQILYCLKVPNIGKMWDKQTAAKSGINVTLAFSGKYWHKKWEMGVRKPYGKKWQSAAQEMYRNEWYKLL